MPLNTLELKLPVVQMLASSRISQSGPLPEKTEPYITDTLPVPVQEIPAEPEALYTDEVFLEDNGNIQEIPDLMDMVSSDVQTSSAPDASEEFDEDEGEIHHEEDTLDAQTDDSNQNTIVTIEEDNMVDGESEPRTSSDEKETAADDELRPNVAEALRLTEQLRRFAEMGRLAAASKRRFEMDNKKKKFFTFCILLVLVVGTFFAAIRHRERNSYEALMKEASALYEQGQYEESLDYYKEASSRYTERIEPFLGTAHASERVGRIEEAVEGYSAALERLPQEDQISRSKIFYEIGRLYALLKMWDKAQESLELATVTDGTNYAAYFALGGVFEGQNKMKDAAVAYKRALDLSPSSDAAQQAIKRVSLALPAKEADFAAIDAEKYKKAIAVGEVALGLRRYDKASQYFAEALALDSSDANIWVSFGEARKGLGDTSGAVASFNRALERNPSHSEAKNKLKALEEERKRKSVPQKKKAAPSKNRQSSALPHAPLNLNLFKKNVKEDLDILAVPVGGTAASSSLSDTSVGQDA